MSGSCWAVVEDTEADTQSLGSAGSFSSLDHSLFCYQDDEKDPSSSPDPLLPCSPAPLLPSSFSPLLPTHLANPGSISPVSQSFWGLVTSYLISKQHKGHSWLIRKVWP